MKHSRSVCIFVVVVWGFIYFTICSCPTHLTPHTAIEVNIERCVLPSHQRDRCWSELRPQSPQKTVEIALRTFSHRDGRKQLDTYCTSFSSKYLLTTSALSETANNFPRSSLTSVCQKSPLSVWWIMAAVRPQSSFLDSAQITSTPSCNPSVLRTHLLRLGNYTWGDHGLHSFLRVLSSEGIYACGCRPKGRRKKMSIYWTSARDPCSHVSLLNPFDSPVEDHYFHFTTFLSSNFIFPWHCAAI